MSRRYTENTAPTERRVQGAGAELCIFEWGPRHSPEGTILLAHATGFHARCWDTVARELAGHHIVSVDLRGHGRSEKPAITNWDVFGADLAAVARELDLHEIVGVGHSMGGHAMTDAAAAESNRFRRLLLIDPVILSPDDYAAPQWDLLGDDVHPTARRRGHFDSPQEMIDRFESRQPYRQFHPQALRDYCTHGLLPSPDGRGFELACPPKVEASIYATSRSNGSVLEHAGSIAQPVLVLRAKRPPPDRELMDFSSSPTWPGLAAQFPAGREIHLAERSHFIPMETPDEVAALILSRP